MMHVIKEVFSDQPGRPKPVLTPEAPQPVAVAEAKRNGKTAVQDGHARGLPVAKKPQFPVDPTLPLAQRVPQDGDAESAALVADPRRAAAQFLEAGG